MGECVPIDEKIRFLKISLRYARLKNSAAVLSGFKNAYEMEVSDYDPKDGQDFDQEMGRVLEGLMPMYRELHAYVRHGLKKR